MSEERRPGLIPVSIQEKFLNFFEPFSRKLASMGIPPALWSILSTLIYFAGFLSILNQKLFLFGILLLTGGFFDLLEHFITQGGRKRPPRSEFTNSLADRLSEAFLFLGIMIFFIKQNSQVNAVVAFIALIIVFLSNYVGVKAREMRLIYNPGLFQRVERVLLLALGALLGSLPLGISLWLISILTLLTLIIRIFSIFKKLNTLPQETDSD